MEERGDLVPRARPFEPSRSVMKPLHATLVLAPLALLLFPACGGDASEGGGPDAAKAAVQTPAEFSRVDALLVAGNYTEVVKELAPKLTAGKCSTEDSLRLAVAYEALSEEPKAERVLRAGLEQEPGATALSLQLSGLYRRLGQTGKALQILVAAREAGGGDEDLALEMAVLKGVLRDLEGAELELQRARKAGAPPDDIDFNLAVLATSRGDLVGAEALLRGIVERGEAPPHVHRELARVRLDLAPEDPERATEVRDSLNQVAGLEEDWRAWEVYGDCEMVLGDAQAAQLYYTYALKWGQNPPRIEDKYRLAARQFQEEMRAQGLETEPERVKHTPPPLGANFEEQNRLAREAREKAAEEARKKEAEGEGDGE